MRKLLHLFLFCISASAFSFPSFMLQHKYIPGKQISVTISYEMEVKHSSRYSISSKKEIGESSFSGDIEDVKEFLSGIFDNLDYNTDISFDIIITGDISEDEARALVNQCISTRIYNQEY